MRQYTKSFWMQPKQDLGEKFTFLNTFINKSERTDSMNWAFNNNKNNKTIKKKLNTKIKTLKIKEQINGIEDNE